MVAWMIKKKPSNSIAVVKGDDAGVDQEAPRGEDIVSNLPYKGRIKETF